MKDRTTLEKEKLAVDVGHIGGKTLRDHTRNIVDRADELTARSYYLANAIYENLFGPEPKDTAPGGPIGKAANQSVSADLVEIDGSLNVLSDALQILGRIEARIGMLREPRPAEAQADETAPARQRSPRGSYA